MRAEKKTMTGSECSPASWLAWMFVSLFDPALTLTQQQKATIVVHFPVRVL